MTICPTIIKTKDFATNMENHISIAIIDSHNLMRSGIKAILASYPEFEVVAESAIGREAVNIVNSLKPDLVLLELNLQDCYGIDILRAIRALNPNQRVVILTSLNNGNDLTACMKIGACGFLLKNISTEYFIDSMRRAHLGDNVFSPEMTSYLVQSLIQPQHTTNPPGLESLTSRELEILGYISIGHSNKIIARTLDLAESTIKVHVQNILRKLELNSRVQAAVFAIQHQVPCPDPNHKLL